MEPVSALNFPGGSVQRIAIARADGAAAQTAGAGRSRTSALDHGPCRCRSWPAYAIYSANTGLAYLFIKPRPPRSCARCRIRLMVMKRGMWSNTATFDTLLTTQSAEYTRTFVQATTCSRPSLGAWPDHLKQFQQLRANQAAAGPDRLSRGFMPRSWRRTPCGRRTTLRQAFPSRSKISDKAVFSRISLRHTAAGVSRPTLTPPVTATRVEDPR